MSYLQQAVEPTWAAKGELSSLKDQIKALESTADQAIRERDSSLKKLETKRRQLVSAAKTQGKK